MPSTPAHSSAKACRPRDWRGSTEGLSLSADFAARTLSGSVSSIAVDWLARTGGGPAPSGFAFSEVRLQGTIAPGTNAFTGIADARTPGNAPVGTGSLDGRFFGREAQEIAGRLDIESPDTTVKAWGSFGGTR
ncbi:MAG: transferrin-binding protein-like solute binding protein [Betaproteobacteria bacterium]|nr:transferrin-binding protein-like solute binding protein [Betaproteobacteria bacterium]